MSWEDPNFPMVFVCTSWGSAPLCHVMEGTKGHGSLREGLQNGSWGGMDKYCRNPLGVGLQAWDLHRVLCGCKDLEGRNFPSPTGLGRHLASAMREPRDTSLQGWLLPWEWE